MTTRIRGDVGGPMKVKSTKPKPHGAPRPKGIHGSRSITLKTTSIFSGEDPTLAKFLRSLQEYYPTDPTHPGITISWLPGLQMYYASVLRYKNSYGTGGYSIFNSKAETLCECLNLLLDQWMQKINPTKKATESLIAEAM